MKLYKRKDFIKLPPKTIYSRVREEYFELCWGLYCKTSGEDWLPDFIEQNLISEAGFPLSDNPDGSDNIQHQLDLRNEYKDFRTDLHCSGRDGAYDDNDRFVVWDKEDIEKLITYLSNCLPNKTSEQ